MSWRHFFPGIRLAGVVVEHSDREHTMNPTKILLLSVFVPVACLKFFSFYKKILKVSEPSLKQLKANLERSFEKDDS